MNTEIMDPRAFCQFLFFWNHGNVALGCSNRCDESVKHSFYYISKIQEHEGEQMNALTEQRLCLWLANINREHAVVQSSTIYSGTIYDKI